MHHVIINHKSVGKAHGIIVPMQAPDLKVPSINTIFIFELGLKEVAS